MARKLIATKEGYIRRLRQMLNDELPCTCCPLILEFRQRRHPKFKFAGETPIAQQCTSEIMEWCRDFVDLSLTRLKPRCPCHWAEDAPVLAREAVARWGAGVHKWQKVGTL